MKLTFLRSLVVAATLSLTFLSGNAWGAQNAATTPGTKPMTSSPSTMAKTAPAAKASPAAKSMPSDAAIADAKSKGMVWVNLNTKVYHKDDAVYGKTKNGQFMTEADAQKSGARMAKASPIGKKKGQ